MLPKRLIFSGGGIKVVSLLGSLLVLEEKGRLKKVKEVCGVSAGAWLAFMVATGYPIVKIQELILSLDFSVIRNMTPEALIGFPETFGIDDGGHLVKFLESLAKVALKLDPHTTFAEFKGLYTFRCWATDLTTRSIREFSASKTPTVRIIDALRASMALPLYFTPLTDPITGHMLSDGGIQGNLPLHALTEDECGESLSIGFSLAVSDKASSEKPVKDFMGFVSAIFACLTHGRNDANLIKWAHRIIRIPVDEYPSWNFEASREDREMLLSKGRLAALSWLKEPMNYITVKNQILRRHSLQ